MTISVGKNAGKKDGQKIDVNGCVVIFFGLKYFQVIRMLISIVVVYIVCWGPLLTFNVLQSFGYIHNFLLGAEKHLKTTFSIMAYFNRFVSSGFDR